MKKIMIGLILTIMLVGVSFAVLDSRLPPAPVLIKINPAVEMDIVLKNMATGEAFTLKSTENGELNIDSLAQLFSGVAYGQEFKAELIDDNRTVLATARFKYVNVAGNEIQVLEGGNPYPYIVQINSPDSTCTKPAPAPIPFTLIAIILALIALLGGGYWVSKKTGTGNVNISVDSKGRPIHGHKNYTSMHLTTTIHAYQPHKKSENRPNYSSTKNSIGKYNYLG